MNDDSRLFAATVNLSRQKGEIRYELADSEVLELYYTEPRLAALIEMDVIRLIDRHLVVNLKEFITPKTHHLSAHAKRNKPACGKWYAVSRRTEKRGLKNQYRNFKAKRYPEYAARRLFWIA